MDDSRELAEKFAAHWHLSVADRKDLGPRGLQDNDLAAAIAQVVRREGRYPPHWTRDMDYEGGLIEKIAGRHYRITWKVEASFHRFLPTGEQLFESVEEACTTYARRFFGPAFDGITIDWSR